VLISPANKLQPLEQASIIGAPVWYAIGNNLSPAHRADAPAVNELPLVHNLGVPAISDTIGVFALAGAYAMVIGKLGARGMRFFLAALLNRPMLI
jgi:hypothetical protein